jgi:putative colanic acid biosynthesis acetyltransferase WcaF
MPTPIRLKHYDNSWYDPGGGLLKRAAWFFLGQPILRAAWIPSSRLRVGLLRMFGATIGSGVVIKPAVDVKYPWHLVVGDHCWIGERTWIDNLTTVRIGSDVCVSQGVYFCTGNHDWTDPHFGLRVKRIQIGDGAWVGARSILTPGTILGSGAVAAAGSVVVGSIPDFEIYAGNPAHYVKSRIMKPAPGTVAKPSLRSIRSGSIRAVPP